MIMRDLAKENGGAPDATVWFDGTKLPLTETVRVNAMLSDAAASDDSDMRNIAHIGTIATSVSLAVAEKAGSSGKDVLAAIAAAYEASGRIGEAISPGEGGFHACVITVFAGAVAAGRLLKLTDEQLAHCIFLSATSIGGLAMSTNSWGREYHAGFAGGFRANRRAGRPARLRGRPQHPRGAARLPQELQQQGRAGQHPRRPRRRMGHQHPPHDQAAPRRPSLSAAVEAAINAATKATSTQTKSRQSKSPARACVPRSAIATQPTSSAPSTACLYYLAAATVDKDFTWVHADNRRDSRPDHRQLQDLVEVDPNPPAVDYTWGWGATVIIEMKDGSSHRSTVNAPIGSGPRGIDWADVEDKYRTLMPESGLSADRIQNALLVIKDFDQAQDVSPLIGLIS